MARSASLNEELTAKEAAKEFKSQIRGKTILITGLNPAGLGAATAHGIASQGPAELILTYRSQAKIDEVISSLNSQYPSVNLRTVYLDLADQESVRAAAKEINSFPGVIDILINNGGVMAVQERTLTSSGLELHFATNYLGHFLLTNLILPKLLASAKNHPPGSTRIVNNTAGWHHLQAVRFDDLNFDGKSIPEDQKPNVAFLQKLGVATDKTYIPEAGYGQSKTAMILFTFYMNEHLAKRGLLTNAVHPGGIMTEIGRHYPEARVAAIKNSGLLTKTAETGAGPIVVCAFDPELNETQPYVLENCQPAPPAAYASDMAKADRLWALSEELVGEKFDLKALSSALNSADGLVSR